MNVTPLSSRFFSLTVIGMVGFITCNDLRAQGFGGVPQAALGEFKMFVNGIETRTYVGAGDILKASADVWLKGAGIGDTTFKHMTEVRAHLVGVLVPANTITTTLGGMTETIYPWEVETQIPQNGINWVVLDLRIDADYRDPLTGEMATAECIEILRFWHQIGTAQPPDLGDLGNFPEDGGRP